MGIIPFYKIFVLSCSHLSPSLKSNPLANFRSCNSHKIVTSQPTDLYDYRRAARPSNRFRDSLCTSCTSRNNNNTKERDPIVIPCHQFCWLMATKNMVVQTESWDTCQVLYSCSPELSFYVFIEYVSIVHFLFAPLLLALSYTEAARESLDFIK